MNILRKRVCLLGIVTSLLLTCTGCSGMSWDNMKVKGKELLDQGRQINQQLEEEAEEVNNNILSGVSLDEEGYENAVDKDLEEQ